MNQLKLSVIVVLLIFLSACGVAEFFIKRTVNGLEDKIVDEFSAYADFTAEQDREIELFARDTANWVRSNRLPLLVKHLEQTAADLERNGRLSETTWRDFVLFLEDPMVLSQAPDVVYRLADLAYSLDSQQTQQVLDRLSEDFSESLAERQDQTADDRHDKIIKGTKQIFKAIGIKRSSSQLKQARTMLQNRHDYAEQNIASMIQNHTSFTELLTDKGENPSEFRARFLAQWKVAERPPSESVPDAWEHNFVVSYGMMNYLLQDLTNAEQIDAVQGVLDYAALFRELSTTDIQLGSNTLNQLKHTIYDSPGSMPVSLK
ncbi:hypothetical protein [Arenicella xantha]|uniref:Lipoprotein n=1 Tax=Arenicella xantha TaxID=644221 RepID=A0A395JPC9_9GAMM|nr:hypothetical protein [Arenicella xantha]RBP53357.1 hypothetical protein DFR28_101743 [Arenicella xantha]